MVLNTASSALAGTIKPISGGEILAIGMESAHAFDPLLWILVGLYEHHHDHICSCGFNF